MKNLKIVLLVLTATFISVLAASAQAPATAPDVKETGKTVAPATPPAPMLVDKPEAKQVEKPAPTIPSGEAKPVETKNLTLPAKNYDEHYKKETIKLPVNDMTPIPVKKDEGAASNAKAKQTPGQQQQNN